MKDSWCERLIYKGKTLYGGAARSARIGSAGGLDNIIKKVSTLVWNEATSAANQADGGKIYQMPKQTKVG